MAKKKGPVLYELLRKDHADKQSQPKELEPPREGPADAKPPEPPVADSTSQPPTARMDAPEEEDGDGLVFHVTRTQAAVAAGVLVTALVVFALIGSRAGKTPAPSGAAQTTEATGTTAADGEPQQPLAMLLPEPGGDPKPEAPVKVLPPEKEFAPAARASDDAEPSEAAQKAPLAKGDSRKAGMNYLVIQIIPERPDAAEHAAEVRKFLAGKKIRTIEVPSANGGIKILGERGFNFDNPDDKKALEDLTEAVKKAGKDYATARYAGRYDFRAPYPEKYKGK